MRWGAEAPDKHLGAARIEFEGRDLVGRRGEHGYRAESDHSIEAVGVVAPQNGVVDAVNERLRAQLRRESYMKPPRCLDMTGKN